MQTTRVFEAALYGDAPPARRVRRDPRLALGRGLRGVVPIQPMKWILCGSIVRIRRFWSRPPYHGYGVPR